MNILILGASGMLGHTLYHCLSKEDGYNVYGAIRGNSWHEKKNADRIITGVDVQSNDSLISAFSRSMPNVVINCVGIIKQLESSKDSIQSLSINSLFPHRLAEICKISKSRLIHYSTDCVFLGNKGNYTENDTADAIDLYGKSKHLGELDSPNCLTLRTSLIGHGINTNKSLVDWFLLQEKETNGFANAIFSGLTTIEHAKVLKNIILGNTSLTGVYHLASEAINKFTLLKLISEIYSFDIKITPVYEPKIDRSLNCSRFKDITGYTPTSWQQQISDLYDFYCQTRKSYV